MFNKIIKYCKDSYNELAYETTWPTRAELTHTAMVVLSASLVIALIVFVFDFISQHVMEFVYPG